ncbi:pyridoxamine 5'-phosphate oxidase family protein [Winogradskyella aurantia]|uniref:Flavin mononucleotide-binding protein n=1 Tax=Winogradskyella aurantia TaxID=1915063 RepID=A0A265URM2_9FLAO|nr:pyridoxamine 5'-phosphate oxidase family protein [Winogradskyella aurantia]OZV67940.1 flavin mononucleotide-binding protein [Winogradskyella aurantia]
MMKSLDQKHCEDVLMRNYVGYLSYIENKRPYTVPITYFFNKKENYIICYSGLGHKIRAMRKQISISLTVAEIFRSNKWKSVLVHGNYDEINGGTAKLYLHEFSLGIKKIILDTENKDLDYISEFSSKIYAEDIPIVFLIRIEELTGKMRS